MVFENGKYTVCFKDIIYMYDVYIYMCEYLEKENLYNNDRILLLVSNINFKLYNLRLRRHAKPSFLLWRLKVLLNETNVIKSSKYNIAVKKKLI